MCILFCINCKYFFTFCIHLIDLNDSVDSLSSKDLASSGLKIFALTVELIARFTGIQIKFKQSKHGWIDVKVEKVAQVNGN